MTSQKYVKKFESGEANPDNIKVKIRFFKSKITLTAPIQLTPAGNLRKQDKVKYLGDAK